MKTNPNIAIAIDHVESLVHIGPMMFNPRNQAEKDLCALDAQTAIAWATSSPERLAAFMSMTMAFILAVQQIITENVEGTDGIEYTDAAIRLLRQRFNSADAR